MFGRIIRWWKGVTSRVFSAAGGNKITGGVPVAVSSDMASAIQRWTDEYKGKAYWLRENRQSLGLPALIASTMATLVTLEAKITVSGSPRAEWLMQQLMPALAVLQTKVEYACAMGGIVMKPYVDGDKLAIDYILAQDFYPIAFNGRGEITSAAFVERKVVGSTVYSRVELHNIADTVYIITNRCFKGYSMDDIGTETTLTEVDEWRDIQPETSIENVSQPMFAYFKMPLGNSIDPKSPLGVSVYAKAEENIKEADYQYQRLLWEYRGGELAIDASEDAFDLDRKGDPILPVGRERLYRTNKLTTTGQAGKGVFDTFSPTLRDGSYISGLNVILAKIENQVGVARGTLCDPALDVRTATEIKINKQNTYATVTSIQMALGKALETLVNAMDIMATLYRMQPIGKHTLSCVWDDSVVTDADTERMRDIQEIRDGIMKKWEYRVKWYGEDEQTARAMTEEEDLTDDEIMGFKAIDKEA